MTGHCLDYELRIFRCCRNANNNKINLGDMHFVLLTILGFSFLVACNNANTNHQDEERYVQQNFKIDLKTPTVEITDYTLITNNLQRDSSIAREIIKAKVILPLAMQKHDRILFDSTLSKDFLYQGEEAFFNRAEYIQDRVNAKWMISNAKYENIVLQFFKEYGVLTYRNKITETDEFGKDQLYTWFWTDIWIKENGSWKLKNLRALN